VSASARPSLPLPDLQYDWKAGKVRIEDRVRLNDEGSGNIKPPFEHSQRSNKV
jgi:hypothetical protein